MLLLKWFFFFFNYIVYLVIFLYMNNSDFIVFNFVFGKLSKALYWICRFLNIFPWAFYFCSKFYTLICEVLMSFFIIMTHIFCISILEIFLKSYIVINKIISKYFTIFLWGSSKYFVHKFSKLLVVS